jgi:Domain of unknown function (DUF4365)
MIYPSSFALCLKDAVLLMLSDNDVKEEWSYLYAHATATHNGYSTERILKDRDSVDIMICAKGKIDPTSHIISPRIELQLKGTSQKITGDDFPFQLSIKNYNDLRVSFMVPRLLVVFTLPHLHQERVSFTSEYLMLNGKAFWLSLAGYKDSDNEVNKTVSIPVRNVLDDTTLRKLMIAASKREAFSNEI